MHILQVHNYYQQAGGEDAVVAAERSLLCDHDHKVITYYKANDDISRGSSGKTASPSQGTAGKLLCTMRHALSLLSVSLKTVWNHQTYREFRKLLQSEQPDVVHCHNTFPLISPSIYWACSKEGVPVVQTLHNYRLFCATPFLFRLLKQPLKGKTASTCNDFNASKGAICELCVGKRFPWSALRYRCYRGSLAGTAVWGAMIVFHRLVGTWAKKVTAYIALTEFQKQKMIEGGFAADKILVKPNFIAEGGSVKSEVLGAKARLNLNQIKPKTGDAGAPYALFVGRLSPEKGCDVLIRAWRELNDKWQVTSRDNSTPALNDVNGLNAVSPQLFIVGEGPAREALESLGAINDQQSTVHFLGKKPKNEVLSLMHSAQFLVLPSVWYEGFPMTIVEAFSRGLPVIASNVGGMTSVIKSGQNGQLFKVGDSSDLAEKMNWAFQHAEEIMVMGKQAKSDFDLKYSTEVNYKKLTAVYLDCLAEDL